MKHLICQCGCDEPIPKCEKCGAMMILRNVGTYKHPLLSWMCNDSTHPIKAPKKRKELE